MASRKQHHIGGDNVKIGKLFAALVVLVSLTVPALAAPMALPTSHYMAANLKMVTEEVSTTDGTVAKITGPMGVPIAFRTLDQVTCTAGKYDISMRIIKMDTNTVITATQPITFSAPTDGYVYSQPVVWQVLFPAVGWYRYEVIANGTPIAFYYFIVSFYV